MNNNFQKQRAKKILLEGIKKFDLNLDGLVVFTEAASGNYAYTPISAAVAGAKKVYAVTRDSRYGTKEEITKNIYNLAKEFGIESKIEVVYEKTKEIISQCDIITNSGFVRPIDKSMIDMMKPTAVISLMWETWEVRHSEIDLEYCKEKEIVVLGTHEDTGGLNLYNGVGFLPLKMLFDSGLSVYNDKILVVGNCLTSRCIYNFLKKCDVDVEKYTFDNKEVLKKLKVFDAIVIAEHSERKNIIGLNSEINIDAISHDTVICHITGDMDSKVLKDKKLQFYPEKIADAHYMSMSLDDLDSRAVIELMQAGFKVGEIMSINRKTKSYIETIDISLKDSLCMGF